MVGSLNKWVPQIATDSCKEVTTAFDGALGAVFSSVVHQFQLQLWIPLRRLQKHSPFFMVNDMLRPTGKRSLLVSRRFIVISGSRSQQPAFQSKGRFNRTRLACTCCRASNCWSRCRLASVKSVKRHQADGEAHLKCPYLCIWLKYIGVSENLGDNPKLCDGLASASLLKYAKKNWDIPHLRTDPNHSVNGDTHQQEKTTCAIKKKKTNDGSISPFPSISFYLKWFP